jgi:uncharacterized repeat protein (TIGR03803 family)
MVFAAMVGGPWVFAGTADQARFTTLYTFAGSPNGAAPHGLAAGPNGVLYGTTSYGGAYGYGTVFELEPPSAPGAGWTQTVLYSFTGQNGDSANPFVSPTVGAGGVLYGTTLYGNYGNGTVYALQPPAAPGGTWTELLVYAGFLNGDTYAYDVAGNLAIGNDGTLYGVTEAGGDYSFGVVFAVAPPSAPGGSWTESALYNFNGDGREAVGLTLSAQGVLFGATLYGGNSGAGTIFSLRPPAAPGDAWIETNIYTFAGGADGIAPLQTPVIGKGALYGTTSGGGSADQGTVFELTPPLARGDPWTKTVLHDFVQGDGKIPNSPLILHNGNIYGTTATGSSPHNRGGTVFELQKPAAPGSPWTEVILHEFGGDAGPSGTLVMDRDGVLYGTTTAGGPNGAGTVYRIASPGTVQTKPPF